MLNLIQTGQERPSILEKDKDEKYHIKFARYCLSAANNTLRQKFLDKIIKNKNFYKGDQWTDGEDIESFLKDDNNQDRNRLSLVQNQIRPMIEQYRGNAIRMNINFRVKSISPQAVSRRETALEESLLKSRIANQPGNPFGEEMKKRYPIGSSEAQTRQIFHNTYVDSVVRDINNLAKYVSDRNKLVNMQVRVAEEMGLTGLGVVKTFEYAGHQQFRLTPSHTFFFDNSAQEYDFSDAEFMGELPEMTPSEIFEMFPDITEDEKKAIVQYSTTMRGQKTDANGKTMAVHSGKVPLAICYWKDGEIDDYGYVKDKYGYDHFTKINYTYEGEDKPRYTDEDLIKVESVRSKKILGNKLKRRISYDVLRMAVIIPAEILAVAKTKNNDGDAYGDILLDWGIDPYQETETIEYNSVKFPYKCYCWGYVDGEIMSPIDDAIDPQRFINRIWSVAENQINNSRGAGTAYDSSMVDDEDEMLRNMNQSKPVKINAKGRGIQNAIGQYDGGVKAGTMVMFNIIDSMKGAIKEVSGVNDAIQGQSTGSDQLVGVTQLMIQRGSLMQEPFYNAITNIFEQCYQSIVTKGKRIYADNDRNLTMAVGDEGQAVIKISKDMRLEDFRCFVKRENSDEMLIDAGNQMLLTFKQMVPPMMDDKRIANLWGRSTPDEVANALREYANEREEMSRMSNEASMKEESELQEQADMEQQEAAHANDEAVAREDIKDLTKIKAEKEKETMKALSKIAPKNKQAENLILRNAKNLQETRF